MTRKNWFSNFVPYDVPLEADGIKYCTPEHFFQAMKTEDPDRRFAIAQVSTPFKAKRLGRAVPLRPNWEDIKVDVMRFAQEHRYRPGTKMLDRLRATTGEIVEWNDWHDCTWGKCVCSKCQGAGANLLGRLLMEIRDRYNENTN